MNFHLPPHMLIPHIRTHTRVIFHVYTRKAFASAAREASREAVRQTVAQAVEQAITTGGNDGMAAATAAAAQKRVVFVVGLCHQDGLADLLASSPSTWHR